MVILFSQVFLYQVMTAKGRCILLSMVLSLLSTIIFLQKWRTSSVTWRVVAVGLQCVAYSFADAALNAPLLAVAMSVLASGRRRKRAAFPSFGTVMWFGLLCNSVALIFRAALTASIVSPNVGRELNPLRHIRCYTDRAADCAVIDPCIEDPRKAAVSWSRTIKLISTNAVLRWLRLFRLSFGTTEGASSRLYSYAGGVCLDDTCSVAVFLETIAAALPLVVIAAVGLAGLAVSRQREWATAELRTILLPDPSVALRGLGAAILYAVCSSVPVGQLTGSSPFFSEYQTFFPSLAKG